MSQLKTPILDQDHIQGGGPTSPITLVEYGDYQCSFCGRAYSQVKRAQQELGAELRFVFRSFPLTSLHKHAEHASEAAEIAGKFGKFWEMHDLLFENQGKLDDESLAGYAEQLGLSRDLFVAELTAGTYAARVHEDFLSGVTSGVNGTPTFFINGERFDGNWEHGGLSNYLKTLI